MPIAAGSPRSRRSTGGWVTPRSRRCSANPIARTSPVCARRDDHRHAHHEDPDEQLDLDGRIVVGVDFCRPMLALAEARLAAAGAAGRVRLLEADVTRLTALPDAGFDAATVGFGLRNVADLDAALREACRLLRPGGALASLDLSWPTRGLMGVMALLYLRRILPAMARLAGARPDDYRWLRDSLERFPDAAGL